MERIIGEFRVVETEDGIRIEIKGDKEAMRKVWRMEPFPGPRSWRKKWRHWGFGPFAIPDPVFFFRWGCWGGPWWEEEEEKAEGEDKGRESPSTV
jgi:hypothetical protein